MKYCKALNAVLAASGHTYKYPETQAMEDSLKQCFGSESELAEVTCELAKLGPVRAQDLLKRKPAPEPEKPKLKKEKPAKKLKLKKADD